MAGIVFANQTAWLTETVQISRGEIWDADDPIVVSHPACFTEDPDDCGMVRRTVIKPARTMSSTEQATSAPGERRNRAPGFRG